jgi:dye decolorizing peroxidase
MFSKLGLEKSAPNTFGQLPAFKIDKLQKEFSDGDVLLHVSADDPLVISHAVRGLVRDSMAFANVRWTQSGFTNAQGVSTEGTRQRNLMGQVDGTDNPELNSEDFSNLVWINDGPSWAKAGTILVLRRIAMNLDTWDTLSRPQKENVIGRTLKNGAPLTGKNETDIPDFEAVNAGGLKVIPTSAHIRRASPTNLQERFFRRPFNYDAGMDAQGKPDVGLLWTAYMTDMNQYISVQRRLADFDLLNMWTTTIGSSAWAIPGGVSEGEILAEGLFS